MSTSYVIDAARTPRGRGKAGKGGLSGVHPQELFAQVLKALQARGGFDAGAVDDVIVGCVSQAGERSDPILMFTAPGPVSEKALRLAGMKARDIDLWEINEAFAAVVLQTVRRLDIDPARVNVNGGAIALGHPLGATGAMLLGTALDELERTGKATALLTMCVGGGQGIATILERV